MQLGNLVWKFTTFFSLFLAWHLRSWWGRERSIMGTQRHVINFVSVRDWCVWKVIFFHKLFCVSVYYEYPVWEIMACLILMLHNSVSCMLWVNLFIYARSDLICTIGDRWFLESQRILDHCFRLNLSWRRNCESSVTVNFATVSHTVHSRTSKYKSIPANLSINIMVTVFGIVTPFSLVVTYWCLGRNCQIVW